MPLPGTGEPSTSDFPPLHRGAAVVAAEPMQIEKVKMRPPSGTVWNGTAARGIQPGHAQPGHAPNNDAMTPQQLSPVTAPPSVSILLNPNQQPMPVQTLPPIDFDPDFPRRIPSSRTPSLYDPSAPALPPRPVRQSPAPGPASAPSIAPTALHALSSVSPKVYADSTVPTPVIVTAASPSAELGSEVIEAKLAALNVKGVVIGPPSSRQVPSYAKIVRRD